MSKFIGKFFTTAEGRVSFEIHDAEAQIIFPIATMLEEKFGLVANQFPVMGLDEVFLDLVKDNTIISLGWDNWIGFHVFALSEKGDELVQEIGNYLNSISDQIEKLHEEIEQGETKKEKEKNI